MCAPASAVCGGSTPALRRLKRHRTVAVALMPSLQVRLKKTDPCSLPILFEVLSMGIPLTLLKHVGKALLGAGLDAMTGGLPKVFTDVAKRAYEAYSKEAQGSQKQA